MTTAAALAGASPQMPTTGRAERSNATDGDVGFDFAALLAALGSAASAAPTPTGLPAACAALEATDGDEKDEAPKLDETLLPVELQVLSLPVLQDLSPAAQPSLQPAPASAAAADDAAAPHGMAIGLEVAAAASNATPLPATPPTAAARVDVPALRAEARAAPALSAPAAPRAATATSVPAAPRAATAEAQAAVAAPLPAAGEPPPVLEAPLSPSRPPDDSAPPTLLVPLPAPLQAPAPTATVPAAAAGALPVIAAPVAGPDFAPALAAQVSVLARDGVQQAELRLNPAEMGPISVRIEVSGDGTSAAVHFAADVAATRSAIEAGLPELAGALREAGLTLVGGGVSEQSPRGRRDGGHDAAPGGRGDATADAAAGDADGAPQAPRRARGVVDLVA